SSAFDQGIGSSCGVAHQLGRMARRAATPAKVQIADYASAQSHNTARFETSSRKTSARSKLSCPLVCETKRGVLDFPSAAVAVGRFDGFRGTGYFSIYRRAPILQTAADSAINVDGRAQCGANPLEFCGLR